MPAARIVLGAAGALAALVLAGCSAGGVQGTAGRPAPRPTGTTRLEAAAAPASPASTTPASTTPASTTPAATTPAPSSVAGTPCAGTKARQVVLVEVHAQHLWLCQRRRAVYDSPVTTGAVDLPYDATPTGTFHIQEKDRNRTLTLLSGARYTVKYWIPFDAPLFGFHDSPWQQMPYGSQRYRTKGSHGCVHLPLATIRHLYGWAEVGATVRIRP